MKIIVCIKQVPNTAQVRLDPHTNTLIRQGLPSIINPDDKAALLQAVKQKKEKGAHITALCMGPLQAEQALREAFALGADEGILLCSKQFAGSDTLATSYLLSCAIRQIGSCDLILCGRQAIDGDTAQVGPELAERLRIPQISYVESFCFPENNVVLAKQKLEDGYAVIQAKTPCLLTIVQDQDTQENCLPGILDVLAAYKGREIRIWNETDLPDLEQSLIGLEGSPTRVIRVFTPQQKGKGILLSGSPKEAAASLVLHLQSHL